MKSSGYSVAKAFCNLAAFGWQPDEALQWARRWVEDQAAFGLSRLGRKHAKAPVDIDCELEPGRLYLAGRYGCYPQIFRVLARRSPGKTVYCPAGDVLRSRFLPIARTLQLLAGCKAEFVAVTPTAIRELRKRLADGANALMLVDLPLRDEMRSRGHAVPTSLGEYRATAALARLPGLIDPDFAGLACERRDGRETIVPLEGDSFDAIVGSLADKVRERPSHYEMLTEMHKFWQRDRSVDIAALFDHDGQRMLLHARDMRIWKVPAKTGLGCDAAALDELAGALSAKLGVPIDDVYSL